MPSFSALQALLLHQRHGPAMGDSSSKLKAPSQKAGKGHAESRGREQGGMEEQLHEAAQLGFNPRDTFYVLNPGNDLPPRMPDSRPGSAAWTAGRSGSASLPLLCLCAKDLLGTLDLLLILCGRVVTSIFSGVSGKTWVLCRVVLRRLQGKAGTAPTPEAIQKSLDDCSLFVYCGHGSGIAALPLWPLRPSFNRPLHCSLRISVCGMEDPPSQGQGQPFCQVC